MHEALIAELPGGSLKIAGKIPGGAPAGMMSEMTAPGRDLAGMIPLIDTVDNEGKIHRTDAVEVDLAAMRIPVVMMGGGMILAEMITAEKGIRGGMMGAGMIPAETKMLVMMITAEISTTL